MSPENIIGLVREALMLAITTAGPLLAVALVVGLTVSVIQATTQLHEPTLAFAPKVFLVGLALVVLGPYLASNLVDYIKLSFERAANVLVGGG